MENAGRLESGGQAQRLFHGSKIGLRFCQGVVGPVQFQQQIENGDAVGRPVRVSN